MQAEICAPILAYAEALDRKDWAAAQRCFSAEVTADYRALRGSHETLSAEAFVARRETALGPLETRHRVTPIHVHLEGETARVRSRYRIERVDPRRPAPNHFHTEGEYEHRLVFGLEGWRITSVLQTVDREEGDPTVHAGARPR